MSSTVNLEFATGANLEALIYALSAYENAHSKTILSAIEEMAKENDTHQRELIRQMLLDDVTDLRRTFETMESIALALNEEADKSTIRGNLPVLPIHPSATVTAPNKAA